GAIAGGLGEAVDYVCSTETDLGSYDGILLPGGFSFGSYLRSGAIARFEPVMQGVEKAAEKGKLVLGVANGFHVLLEANLLPGAMLPNANLKFQCGYASVVVENNQTAFTRDYQPGEALKLPIAHGDGNYYCDE